MVQTYEDRKYLDNKIFERYIYCDVDVEITIELLILNIDRLVYVLSEILFMLKSLFLYNPKHNWDAETQLFFLPRNSII